MAGVKRNIQEMYNGNNGTITTNGNNQMNGNSLMQSNLNANNSNGQSMNIDNCNDQMSTQQNEAKKTRLDNQIKQEPSRVVHLRNIPHQLTENEIIFLGLNFGMIKNVLFLRSKNQAFLEFEQLNDAQQMISHFNNSSTTFSGKKIFVQYSNHQELNTDPNNSNNLVAQAALNEACQLHKSAKHGGKNTVLRATILNMIYPVTLDVLHQIFSKFGQVLKIITFNKNDKFQVLIQIKDSMSAQSAKMALHNQNIYNGCCTLQIDFSKLATLEVRYNNDKSRDYTNLLLPTGDGQQQNGQNNNNNSMNSSLGNLNDSQNNGNTNGYQQQSLIGQPPQTSLYGQMPTPNTNGHHHNHSNNNVNPFSSMHQQNNSFNSFNMNNHHHGGHHGSQMGGGPGMMQPPQVPHNHQNNHQNMNQNVMQQNVNSSPISTPVLLVSNLNEEFVTPEALFTLFGVYGDVLRVKILFNKKDSALINFSNAQQAATALSNLDRVKLWSKQIRVFPSKHLTVQMPKDGQPDSGLTKDFSSSPLHRFKKPGSKNFNNIFPPSQTLHLSNIPPNVSEQELKDLFAMYGTVKGFKFFQKDRKMALLQMDSVEEAITALIATHNYQLADNMHLRCTFSKATI